MELRWAGALSSPRAWHVMTALTFEMKFLHSSAVWKACFHVIPARMDVCVYCQTHLAAKRWRLEPFGLRSCSKWCKAAHPFRLPKVWSRRNHSRPETMATYSWATVYRHIKHSILTDVHAQKYIRAQCLVEEFIKKLSLNTCSFWSVCCMCVGLQFIILKI